MHLCKLCEKRRPRRFCPGVGGDICPRCCGEEREVTVNCPFDCSYLQEARRFEKLPDLDPEEIPHKDIRLPESFLREQEDLFGLLGGLLVQAAAQTHGVVDTDAAEALDAMVRTYRTKQTGLYYETRPNNTLAAAVQQRMNTGLAEVQRRIAEHPGLHMPRDKDILGVLVFLRRLAAEYTNGRRLGRRFLHLLHGFGAVPAEGSGHAIVAP